MLNSRHPFKDSNKPLFVVLDVMLCSFFIPYVTVYNLDISLLIWIYTTSFDKQDEFTENNSSINVKNRKSDSPIRKTLFIFISNWPVYCMLQASMAIREMLILRTGVEVIPSLVSILSLSRLLNPHFFFPLFSFLIPPTTRLMCKGVARRAVCI